MSSSPSIQDTACQSYLVLTKAIGMALVRFEANTKATHERFNVFSTLLEESDEVRLHTRFIHCLLDPIGSHDCGSMFLDLFFETIELLGAKNHNDEKFDLMSLLNGKNWGVYKEASRSPHGQIDLLLERSGFGIAIENKIYAGEQTEQLVRYNNYLQGKHGDSSALIYLTLDGKQSQSAGNLNYYRISYKQHILAWLDACLRATYHIIPINQTIIQYRTVVRRLTHQNLDNEFMKPVLDLIRQNPDLVRHRIIISDAVNTVRGEVLDDFAARLIKVVMEFVDDVRVNPGQRDGKFSLAGSLWVTPHSTSVLRAFPFKIWLELFQNGLILGFKVVTPKGIYGLDADTQHLLNEMNRLMDQYPEQAEFRKSFPNEAWPTGWDVPLNPLNDDVIADWMKQGTLDIEVAKVSKAS